MDVRVTHCTVCWGYHRRALAIAAQLRRQFGETVEVVGGTLGQFDVYVDGELVVSKGKSLLQRVRSGRLPDASQIMAVIERHLPEHVS